MKFIIALLGAALLVPQQTPTITVDVQLQQVVATVRDASGHVVRGLRQDDFIVESGGTPQAIANFSDDPEVPISLGILIDSSGSMGNMPGGTVSGVAAASAITRVLLRRIKPDDEVLLMSFASGFSVRQAFTKDHAQIERALAGLRPEGGSTLLTALSPATQQVRKSRNPKRALIVMTDAYFGGDIHQAVAAVRQAEVPIFTFAMRSVDFSPKVRSCNVACHAFEVLPPRANVMNPFPNLTQPFLDIMAGESGGRSSVMEIDTRNALKRINAEIDDIAAELRGQYVLAYYIKPSMRDQSISVKTRNPSYKVHTRRDASIMRP